MSRGLVGAFHATSGRRRAVSRRNAARSEREPCSASSFDSVSSAMRWKYYADRLCKPRSLGQLTGFYFIGMYFNLMLPTSVGGDVVRAWYLDGRSGRRLSAFASVLLDRLNGLLMLVALAAVAVTLSPLPLPAWIVASVWGALACSLLGFAGLLLFAWRAPAAYLQGEPDDAEKAGARTSNPRAALRLFCQPRVLAATLLLSLCVQAANVLIVWLIGQALHVSVPSAYYWVMVPMVTLLTLLPISINGMGVREEATALFLAPLGIAESAAVTLSVLWFAVSASVSLLGGAVYLFGGPVAGGVVSGGSRVAGGGTNPSPTTDHPHSVTHQSPLTQGESCGPLGGDSDQGRTGQSKAAA